MKITSNVRNFVFTPDYSFEGFYISDYWDMENHPLYNDLNSKWERKLKQNGNKLDFCSCKNKWLATEVKYYCQYLLEIRKINLVTFTTHIRSIKVFFAYVNKKSLAAKTITEYDRNTVIDDYVSYLVGKGFKKYREDRSNISRDMKPRERHNKSPYISFLHAYYDYIYEMSFVDSTREYDKDKWNIRRLPFKINGFSPASPRYTISFEKIAHKKLKGFAKKFTYERLKYRKLSTCMGDLEALRLLSSYLLDRHPETVCLTQLNRDIMEEFLLFLETNEKLAERTKTSKITSIRLFFDWGRLHNLDGMPITQLIMLCDFKYRCQTQPKFYTDDVIGQINEKLEHLPLQIARMFFVLQNVGMRVGELCMLKSDCLTTDTNGEYILTYFQDKTYEYNSVPITKTVAGAIMEAMDESKRKFGVDTEYVFAKAADKPIWVNSLSYYLNRLVYYHNITDELGNLVRIKSHTFRSTVATKYANMGLNPNMIRMLLGHRTIGTLKYYVEIHNETVHNAMNGILKHQNDMIMNIGDMKAAAKIARQNKYYVPLPNGICAKPLTLGKCSHANACYTCTSFTPLKEYLPLYERHAAEAKCNIETATAEGFTRVVQVNQDLETAILKTIERIKKLE